MIKHLSLLILWVVFLSACSSSKHTPTPAFETSRSQQQLQAVLDRPRNSKGYICPNASNYRGNKVGTGHCVSLIQTCSAAPHTSQWRQGPRVKGLSLQPGTVIATFRNGKYPNVTGWHAAIYISQDSQGIWVWDQWVGKPVHKRLIRFKNGRGTANNDGDAYSVVY